MLQEELGKAQGVISGVIWDEDNLLYETAHNDKDGVKAF